MGSHRAGRRARRQFSEEFRAGAVRLVLDEGKTVALLRASSLSPSSLANWVKYAPADRTKGKTGLPTAEREELARLRKENRILQEEREILKKATAFFAKQSQCGFGSWPWRRPSTRSRFSVDVCV